MLYWTTKIRQNMSSVETRATEYQQRHRGWSSQIRGKVLVLPPTGCMTSGEQLNHFPPHYSHGKNWDYFTNTSQGCYHTLIMLCFTICQCEGNSKEYCIWNVSETGFVTLVQGMRIIIAKKMYNTQLLFEKGQWTAIGNEPLIYVWIFFIFKKSVLIIYHTEVVKQFCFWAHMI